MPQISVKTHFREGLVDITEKIEELAEQEADKRLCVIFVPHTTAAVTINENADPDVRRDLMVGLQHIAPHLPAYLHAEGNSAAHLKAGLLGSSEMILLQGGRLRLGTWQGIYLAEFDGPRTRKVMVEFL